MAKNTGNGSRKGSIADRTQVQNPTTTGTFVKRDGSKFKGVAVEPDGRRNKG